MSTSKNYAVSTLGTYATLGEKEAEGAKGRVMLGKALGLTASEISVNSAPAGTFMPFVHSHKQNEEVYIIVSGNGVFHVDGEEFPIQEGSVIRVDPNGKRAIKAGNETLVYICMQGKSDSLMQASMDDGIINEEKASWM